MERLKIGYIIGKFMYKKESEQKTIRIRNLKILENEGLLTRDQIYMILSKKAYVSKLRSNEWVFGIKGNFKL